MIELLVVDDHKIVINGIKLALKDQREIQIIDYALSAEDALKKLTNLKPDIVLLDIQLPDMDGLDLCKEIKKRYPQVRIIGITTFTEVSFIAEMLRNGADGYLFKDTSEKELAEAIKTVYYGNQYLSQEVNRKLVDQALQKPSRRTGFIPKITRREQEVLNLIAAEHTTQEIADQLFLSVSTVEKHRMNLCIKLEARNSVGLLKKAIKFGLIS
ncbi:MAG: response regulator transcription factor [Saprospiraceae bacterium]|nr:response regulator transcription factor [Saprospiraceae bacterium]